MVKRRVRNNLRFFALWQKLKQEPDKSVSSSTLFEDYINEGFLYCDKKGVSSMEYHDRDSDRIESHYKVTCRKQTKDFDVNDRLLFFESLDYLSDKMISDDKILKVESAIDKTGRGERITLICDSGTYTGKASVNPRFLKSIVFKGAIANINELSSIANLNNPNRLFQAGYNVDILIRANMEKNPWIFSDNRRIPIIASFNPNFMTPSLEYGGNKITMQKHTNSANMAIFYAPAIPAENTQIYII